MANMKWGAAAAVFAFILSLLIGLISGAGLFALARALIFAFLFFALGCAVHWLLSRFLSELIDGNGEEVTENALGSNVDISLEDEEAALGAGEEGALLGNTLDQNREDGYTKNEAPENTGEDPAGESPPADEGPEGGDAAEPAALQAAAPADNPEAVDDLPDLEDMAAAFIPPRDAPAPLPEPAGGTETVLLAPSGLPSGDKKAQDLAGNYKTNDMASAIQTILKREKG